MRAGRLVGLVQLVVAQFGVGTGELLLEGRTSAEGDAHRALSCGDDIVQFFLEPLLCGANCCVGIEEMAVLHVELALEGVGRVLARLVCRREPLFLLLLCVRLNIGNFSLMESHLFVGAGNGVRTFPQDLCASSLCRVDILNLIGFVPSFFSENIPRNAAQRANGKIKKEVIIDPIQYGF